MPMVLRVQIRATTRENFFPSRVTNFRLKHLDEEAQLWPCIINLLRLWARSCSVAVASPLRPATRGDTWRFTDACPLRLGRSPLRLWQKNTLLRRLHGRRTHQHPRTSRTIILSLPCLSSHRKTGNANHTFEHSDRQHYHTRSAPQNPPDQLVTQQHHQHNPIRHR